LSNQESNPAAVTEETQPETRTEQGESQLSPDIPVPVEASVPEVEQSTAPEEKTTTPEKEAPEPEKPARRGRPPKTEKAEKAPKTEKPNRQKASGGIVGGSGSNPKEVDQDSTKTPREAPRPNGTDQIVYLSLTELQPFKNHPFSVRDDSEMKALVESVRAGGVNQPALVRPLENGGYEIIAGHRRLKASELAGYTDLPCIVREMTDDEAILAMTDDNLRQRSEILPSEKAASLKMQFEAIKHQGVRGDSRQKVPNGELGKRSIEMVGERNNMNGKQVQRYIRLTNLVTDLKKAIDENRLGFTSAVEISFISRKNQNYIAVALDSEQVKPSLAQSQRMRELDKQGQLNGDIIDGILSEEKKEEIRVILNSQELGKYFGPEKTPREMKDQILKLLDEWATKEKTLTAPEKKPERTI
jgi:hypothetical protein